MLSFAPNATRYFTPKELLRAGSSVTGFDEQCRHDVATFACEDVVSPAGCQCVHGFYTCALGHQTAQKRWWREAQAHATAKKYQLWSVGCQLVKMLVTKVFKTRAMPVNQLPARANDDAALNFFTYAISAQTDPASPVTKDGLDVKAVWLKFHGVRAVILG